MTLHTTPRLRAASAPARSLAARVAMLVAFAAVVMLLLQLAVTSLVVRAGFDAVEDDQTERLRSKMHTSLRATEDRLVAVLREWAQDDAIARFAAGTQGEGFLATRVSVGAFVDRELAALVIADAGGAVRHASALQPGSGRLAPVDAELREVIERIALAKELDAVRNPFVRLVYAGEQPYLIATQATTNALRTWQPTGRVVLVQRFDGRRLVPTDALRDIRRLQMSRAPSAACSAGLARSKRDSASWALSLLEREACAVLRDSDGRAHSYVTFLVPRASANLARETLQLLFFSSSVVTLLLIGGVVGLLRHYVMRRVARLDSELRNARVDTDEGVNGITLDATDDEIGRLALNARNLLARVIEQRRIAVQHESALRMVELKSRFIAIMSHEIRTPMNGVMGMLELVLRSPLEESQKRRLTTAYGSASALLKIINQVLDLSKLEAGRLELDPRPASLATCLREVRELFADNAQAKGLKLTLAIDPQVAAEHVFDPDRLRQVMLNLVSNALKFTAQGEVTIDLRSLGSSGGAERLRFEVRDTGRGIAPEALPNIFEAFVQEKASTTREYGGTGLGLAVCQQLVVLMGSRIEVKSEPGVGTCFGFTLDLPLGVERAAQVA